LNIDFFSLFSAFDPKIYMGGDNVIFWGPLAWTVIYGLFIATFLTLIVVPILFYFAMRLKMKVHYWRNPREEDVNEDINLEAAE
jgi:Cu/Ag efflux pump CusA